MKTVNNLRSWRNPSNEVLIKVLEWKQLVIIDNQYIDNRKNLHLIWNYYCRVGLIHVVRKLKSRLSESVRNKKTAGFGIGIILDAPIESIYRRAERVIFFASNHPQNPDVISIDYRYIVKIDSTLLPSIKNAEIPAELMQYIGWSPYSGRAVDPLPIEKGLCQLLSGDSKINDRLQIDVLLTIPEYSERYEGLVRLSAKPRAVLFGLGNYAKTQIIPNIAKFIDLACVHEIDPAQLNKFNHQYITIDTSPLPREGEKYDAWFIAGYHHTHTDLALRALIQNAYAIVEKPLSTTWGQFDSIQENLRTANMVKLFTCFHKRYSIFSDWLKADLNWSESLPVDMHTIVYEIPLPALHWYNWPVSGSRIISNGSHWLDYFMFVNDYSPVRSTALKLIRKDDLVIAVGLENGANLFMSLTDKGSARLGVRDTIELRTGNTTVKMIDGAFYEAENDRRVLRKRKVNPMDAYKRMYMTICKKIVNQESGDTLKSLRSTELMLQLEDQYQNQVKSKL